MIYFILGFLSGVLVLMIVLLIAALRRIHGD